MHFGGMPGADLHWLGLLQQHPHQGGILRWRRKLAPARAVTIAPLVGQALEAVEASGAGHVVLLGGLGGGTCGDACVAIARELHARGRRPVIGVLLPFRFEGHRRSARAEAARLALRATGARLCVVSNEEGLEEEGRDALIACFREREMELLTRAAREVWHPDRSDGFIGG